MFPKEGAQWEIMNNLASFVLSDLLGQTFLIEFPHSDISLNKSLILSISPIIMLWECLHISKQMI